MTEGDSSIAIFGWLQDKSTIVAARKGDACSGRIVEGNNQ